MGALTAKRNPCQTIFFLVTHTAIVFCSTPI